MADNLKMKVVGFIFVLVLSVFQTYGLQDDYLKWVDLSDKIPENAVRAGGDANNNTVYVARVHLKIEAPNFEDSVEGTVPASIIAGQTSIDVVLHEQVYTVSKGIQILTAVNNTIYEWKFVNYLTYPKLFDTEDKHPVRSGWEFDGMEFNSTVYIGKTDAVIGKIFTTALMYADNMVLYIPDETQKNVSAIQYYFALIYYY